jgi:hypothetical protein
METCRQHGNLMSLFRTFTSFRHHGKHKTARSCNNEHFVFLKTDAGVGDSPRCTNPNGQSGACLNIKQCPSLLNMLRQQLQVPGVADFLRASACGYEGSDPKVCCPGLETRPTAAPADDSSRESVRESVGLPDTSECGTAFAEVEDRRVVGGYPAKLGECLESWVSACRELGECLQSWVSAYRELGECLQSWVSACRAG